MTYVIRSRSTLTKSWNGEKSKSFLDVLMVHFGIRICQQSHVLVRDHIRESRVRECEKRRKKRHFFLSTAPLISKNYQKTSFQMSNMHWSHNCPPLKVMTVKLEHCTSCHITKKQWSFVIYFSRKGVEKMWKITILASTAAIFGVFNLLKRNFQSTQTRN